MIQMTRIGLSKGKNLGKKRFRLQYHIFFFHNNSYKIIHSISSAEDFWKFHNLAAEKMQWGMFFLTREHVFPCYDDPSNKDGGCFSIKVPNESFIEYWQQLCVSLLTETLAGDKTNEITCISTSPKKMFCIIKIWLGTTGSVESHDLALPKMGHIGEVLFRAWSIGS
jgi:hypothetical protein